MFLRTAIPCLFCVVPAFGFLAHDIFKTRDSRLFDLFCVTNADDLATISQNTSTQQSIFKNAVKRSVSKFLSGTINVPEPSDPELLSLSELYQTFLGPCSSPDRFILAVNELVESAASLDTTTGIKSDPRYHFDGEAILEGQALLVERYALLVTAINTGGKFSDARRLLGRSLHSLALFYAHTSWVEQEEAGPLGGLGLPGGEMPELAGPAAPPCQGSSLEAGVGLTSGYFGGGGEGRCRHGSREDPPGLGGINKDTGSSCWSQHAALHAQAASLATEAVQNYIDHLRLVVGDENFRQLFDLATTSSSGSALVIAIDQSSSMCDEIDQVQRKVTEIVERALQTGIHPSKYVLTPFDDPPVPRPTSTTNPEEYLEAVRRTNCHGGGSEQFWTAVQLSLTNAPSYSDVIVFTDEPGDDRSIKDNVIGLAESLHTQVSVIYSGGNLIQDHLDLCSATGGLCIKFDKVDADQIVALLSSSIEESKAVIAMVKGASSFRGMKVYLDSSLVATQSTTEFRISGLMTFMNLQSPDGPVVDLTDDEAMAAAGMNVTLRLSDLLQFSFKPAVAGEWLLMINSNGLYDVTVQASCTFSFLSTFSYLDLQTNHPNLQAVPGRPVIGSVPSLMLTLTGNHNTFVASLDRVTFYSQIGQDIENHTFAEQWTGQEDLVLETSYPASTGLTGQSFYVRLEGLDNQGKKFHRVFPTLTSPSSTQVQVTASSAVIGTTQKYRSIL